MCGRFTLQAQPRELVELFELDELPEELRPRFNIAPSQSIPAVGLKADGTRCPCPTRPTDGSGHCDQDGQPHGSQPLDADGVLLAGDEAVEFGLGVVGLDVHGRRSFEGDRRRLPDRCRERKSRRAGFSYEAY